MTVRVILLEPEKAGNIGAVARAMKNFDLHDLWLVNPKVPIDGESRAYAMHGAGVLDSARTVADLSDATRNVSLVVGTSAVRATSGTNVSRVALTPRQMAKKANASNGKIALVFGRESSGLNNQEVGQCDFMVTIPASHSYNVLNISSAASILFYELFQNHTQAKVELASSTVLRHLLTHFHNLAKNSESRANKSMLAERAFRNIIARSFITKREAYLLMGIFRKASNKLR